MGKKRFMKSLPHVNASSLSPPLSHQLNLTNDIRDINCSLCYWLKSERIKQWHSDTWSYVFVNGMSCQTASTWKKLAKRGPKPKQMSPSDYCTICGCSSYVDSTEQSSCSRKATENLFIETLWRKFKKILVLPFCKRKISHVGFVSLAVIRLEAPGLNFLLLKPTFKKASMTMIAFGLKECPHHLMVLWKVMQWLKCQLLSLPLLDHILIILCNSDATNTTFFSLCLSFTAANYW